MTLKISDITKFTLQDYPGKTACIIWFAGCNMKCKYCHNVEFFGQNNNFIEENDVLDFLKSRIDLFDGIVLSGGECTLEKDIYDFIVKIKNLGFKIKVDTNGLNIGTIKKLVDNNLVDFFALDFKAPKNKFNIITQVSEKLYKNFEKTLSYLISKLLDNKIDMEIRTTVHTDLLQENDINEIIKLIDLLKYNKTYYIQNFRNDNKKTLSNLENQKYIINREKIIKPINFTIGYRNFF